MVIMFRKPKNVAGPNWSQKFVLKGREGVKVAEYSNNRFARENKGLPFEMVILKGDNEYNLYEYRRLVG